MPLARELEGLSPSEKRRQKRIAAKSPGQQASEAGLTATPPKGPTEMSDASAVKPRRRINKQPEETQAAKKQKHNLTAKKKDLTAKKDLEEPTEPTRKDLEEPTAPTRKDSKGSEDLKAEEKDLEEPTGPTRKDSNDLEDHLEEPTGPTRKDSKELGDLTAEEKDLEEPTRKDSYDLEDRTGKEQTREERRAAREARKELRKAAKKERKKEKKQKLKEEEAEEERKQEEEKEEEERKQEERKQEEEEEERKQEERKQEEEEKRKQEEGKERTQEEDRKQAELEKKRKREEEENHEERKRKEARQAEEERQATDGGGAGKDTPQRDESAESGGCPIFHLTAEEKQMIVTATRASDVPAALRTKLINNLHRQENSNKIPGAQLARWQEEKGQRGQKFSFLQQAVRDPTFKTVKVTEEHTSKASKLTETDYVWITKGDLYSEKGAWSNPDCKAWCDELLATASARKPHPHAKKNKELTLHKLLKTLLEKSSRETVRVGTVTAAADVDVGGVANDAEAQKTLTGLLRTVRAEAPKDEEREGGSRTGKGVANKKDPTETPNEKETEESKLTGPSSSKSLAQQWHQRLDKDAAAARALVAKLKASTAAKDNNVVISAVASSAKNLKEAMESVDAAEIEAEFESMRTAVRNATKVVETWNTNKRLASGILKGCSSDPLLEAAKKL